MRRAVLLLIALLALAGCGGSGNGSESAATEPAPEAGSVKKLANILDLRSDFEADAGKTRTILLFSPT